MFVLENWMGLQGEERSTNETFIEEAWEVISEENIRISTIWRRVVHQEVQEVKKIYKRKCNMLLV
jgi:hypothetical protein